MIGSKPIICYLFFVLFVPTPHTSTVMYYSGLIWCILFYFVSFVELLTISLFFLVFLFILCILAYDNLLWNSIMPLHTKYKNLTALFCHFSFIGRCLYCHICYKVHNATLFLFPWLYLQAHWSFILKCLICH